MTLQEALHGFSQHKYYEISGYRYQTFAHGGHGDLKFRELPEKLQLGVLEIIKGVFRVQKMVYNYDIGYVSHCMKSCGIILRGFYDGCGISSSFWLTRSLRVDREYRLMCIRLQLMIILNRLFEYVLE